LSAAEGLGNASLRSGCGNPRSALPESRFSATSTDLLCDIIGARLPLTTTQTSSPAAIAPAGTTHRKYAFLFEMGVTDPRFVLETAPAEAISVRCGDTGATAFSESRSEIGTASVNSSVAKISWHRAQPAICDFCATSSSGESIRS